MDEAERLMHLLSTTEPVSATEKVSFLADLDRLRDPRVVPFVLRLVLDESQPNALRLHALRMLRNGRLTADERGDAADTCCKLLFGASEPDLRLQAAVVLGEFTDIPNVLSALGSVVLADEPLDLRYAAFTSAQRSGPTSESLALLHRLSSDETLLSLIHH
jgi:hypothetical protein